MLVHMKVPILNLEDRSTTTEISYVFVENLSTHYQKIISRNLANGRKFQKVTAYFVEKCHHYFEVFHRKIVGSKK